MYQVCRAVYSIYRANRGILPGVVANPTWGYIAQGKARYELNGETFWVDRGSLIWLPQNTQRAMRAQSTLLHLHSVGVELDSCPAGSCQRLVGGLPAKAEVVHISNPGHVESLFKLMERLWVQRSPWAELEMRGVGLQIAAQFFSARSEPDVQPHVKQRVNAVLDYLATHYTEPDLSLDDLAAVSGWSKQYFIGAFRRLTGQTPMAYVRRLQINLSLDLLALREGSVQEIAERVGFRDAAYFTRAFTRHVGKPPSYFMGVENRYVRVHDVRE